MTDLRVDDLSVWRDGAPGGCDAGGNKIICIYARLSGNYAVYRTEARMAIQYADAPDLAARQRAALVPLVPLRGEITGLIDGWKSSDISARKSRAERYHRRIADALVVALEEFQAGCPIAIDLLEEIRDDILAQRKSIARFQYLAITSATAVATLAILWIADTIWFSDDIDSTTAVLNAVGGGVVGSFFSVATGLRNRSILTDLRWLDNMADAVLRMAVGIIGAILLITLLLSGTTSLQFDLDVKTAAEAEWMRPFVLGALAGFLERLVPDLLSNASLLRAGSSQGAPSGGSSATVAAGRAVVAAQTAAAPGLVLAGAPAAAVPQADDGDDNCLCDAPADDDEEATEDIDLPVAIGGIAADVPPPSDLAAAEPPGEDPIVSRADASGTEGTPAEA